MPFGNPSPAAVERHPQPVQTDPTSAPVRQGAKRGWHGQMRCRQQPLDRAKRLGVAGSFDGHVHDLNQNEHHRNQKAGRRSIGQSLVTQLYRRMHRRFRSRNCNQNCRTSVSEQWMIAPKGIRASKEKSPSDRKNRPHRYPQQRTASKSARRSIDDDTRYSCPPHILTILKGIGWKCVGQSAILEF